MDAANDPNSIIRQENIIAIDPNALPEAQEVITASSVMEEALALKRTEVATIANESERQKQVLFWKLKHLIAEAVSNLGASIKNINDLKSDEVRKLAFEKMLTSIESNPAAKYEFKTAIVEAAKEEYESVVAELIEKIIPIPRVLIQQKHDVKSGF